MTIRHYTGQPLDRPEQCQWYALCTNEAVGYVRHVALGNVPTCQRCADKHDLDLHVFITERTTP